MQAIQTRFLGPTNYKGSRVKAFCRAGSMSLPWDNSLNSEDNHVRAAKALASKLGWTSEHYKNWHMGTIANDDCVFVMENDEPVFRSLRGFLADR